MISLPIDKALPELERAFKNSQNVVITAAPGSGKTTRVPPAALNWVQGQILVLEPRRVAALAAASRIAEENNWKLGGAEVGYQVRFDNQCGPQTRLRFLTEALLVRQMISDPELKNVDLVILDEFHERSSHVDLALGLLRELQLMGHPIKLIVMSATLESQKISEYLGQAPIIDIPGQLFELQIINDTKPQLIRTMPEFFDRVVSQIKNYSRKTDKDALVFLPGVGEIHRVASMLSEWSKLQNVEIQTLFAQAPLEEQKRILKKGAGQRIILSTNIAESALTLDGVGLVIDSGLERRAEFDERTETEKISLQRISKASATQRAGRAARQFKGQCVRLWTKSDEMSFPNQIPAEILKIDLSSSLLFLAAQGVAQFENFGWFERPPIKNLKWAQQELQKLNLLNSENSVTELGRKTLSYPLTPRLGRLLSLAEERHLFFEAAELVALLQEKDILAKNADHLSSNIECDLINRWTLWKENSRDLDQRSLGQVTRVAEQLQRMAPRKSSTNNQPLDQKLTQLHQLIVAAFFDRLCHRRQANSDRALRRGGRGVLLTPESLVRKSDFFVPLKSIDVEAQNETKVSWACGFSETQLRAWAGSEIQKKSQVIFDKDRQRLIRSTQNFIGDLPIDESVVTEPTQVEIQEHLPEVIFASWPALILKNSELQNWYERYKFIISNQAEPEWTLNDEILKEICAELALGHKNLAEIEELDLVSYLENHLPIEIQKKWKSQWPLQWQAPNGRWVKIQYLSGQSPFVEIKIQEIFGLKSHPKMFGNETALVFHLLAPSQRPVQVTADIPRFWSGSYQDVRKELKPRYPKHSWPEDPLNSVAEVPRARRWNN